MCQRSKETNYYLVVGLLISSTTYLLYDADMIPHWLRLTLLIIAIVVMLYGVIKKNTCKN
jgi:multisubunit Na+/H+ antiporter MnhC subunit